MRQAIITKYISAGNVRGSRIKARCAAGSITLHWDDSLNSSANHIAAAKALAAKLDWKGQWHSGGLLNGQTVFVSPDEDSFVI